MNKNLIFLLLGIFLVGLVSAANSFPPVKSGECIDIKQSCSSCSYVNLSVSYPNSSISISNEAMISQGAGLWKYNYCDTNTLGRYEVAGEGDLSGTPTSFDVLYFDVNNNGSVIETTDAIVYIGVLFFVFILSLVCMGSGVGMLRVGSHILWGGILLIGLGGVLLYGATFMANNYIILMAGSMGGESIMSGYFLFFARILKYTPYLVIAMVLYFVIKWQKSIKDSHNFGDGWDDNNY